MPLLLDRVAHRLAFAETLRMPNYRIGAFVILPVESLDRLSLQRQIDEIGAGA